MLKNPRHELFAQELAKGKNASEAYRNAGYRDNRANACRMQHDERIKQRVTELLTERDRMHAKATEKAADALAIDRKWVMARLVENATQALQAGDRAVANRALELIGKEQGMFIERRESGQPGDFAALSSVEEVLSRVRVELGDQAADMLAQLVTATHAGSDAVQ